MNSVKYSFKLFSDFLFMLGMKVHYEHIVSSSAYYTVLFEPKYNTSFQQCQTLVYF